MSVNLGQCIVTLLGHNWDLNSILLFKLLHFNFEWIVFCDLVSCKDNFILHKSDFSCLIWQCWNISGTTMWPQAIGTTSHPNFGMHTGSQGPNPAIFSQNCPNRAMLPGTLSAPGLVHMRSKRPPGLNAFCGSTYLSWLCTDLIVPCPVQPFTSWRLHLDTHR